MLKTKSNRADKRAQARRVVSVLEAFRMITTSLGAGVNGRMSRRRRLAAEAVEVGIVPVGAEGEGAEMHVVEQISVKEWFLEDIISISYQRQG